ncbi:MAG: DUF4102 domain-containing protein [Pseudomonadales bacterium]|nr:DUF4102 domain-containing protein [Pseudomonadales bacterium]
MPEKGNLTAAAARAARKPGLYRADPTLYLRVARGGSKQWIQRIVVKGRRRDIGLGPFPVVGLTDARGAEAVCDANTIAKARPRKSHRLVASVVVAACWR